MNETGHPDTIELNANQLACYQLRRTGWTIKQVAQELDISVSTVVRWDDVVSDQLASLPSTQIAKDHLQTMVPQCIKIFQEALDFPAIDANAMRLKTEIANKILNSAGAITDRKNVVLVDDTNATDDELISEANRIIQGVGKE